MGEKREGAEALVIQPEVGNMNCPNCELLEMGVEGFCLNCSQIGLGEATDKSSSKV
jgi:hypothetical protein